MKSKQADDTKSKQAENTKSKQDIKAILKTADLTEREFSGLGLPGLEYRGPWYRGQMTERSIYLEAVKETALAELERLPEGQLSSRMSKGIRRFYCRRSGKDSNGSYITKENGALVRQLAQKAYLKKLLEAVEGELTALEKCEQELAKPRNVSAESVYDSIDDWMQELTTPLITSDARYAELWRVKPFETSQYFGENKNQHTEQGEYVRSKSELLIANMLYRAGVNYKYEHPLTLGRSMIYPDFTILDVRQRKVFYWEHFGKIDEQDYAVNAVKRISAYSAAGLGVVNNLIVTWETEHHPLSSDTVRQVMVNNGLLGPRCQLMPCQNLW